MLRQISRPVVRCGIRQYWGAGRNRGLVPWRGGGVVSSPVTDLMEDMRDMQRRMGALWQDVDVFRPLQLFDMLAEHPTSTEAFRLRSPIIEEDGVKKFKLEFDVCRFRPEEVEVKTSEKDRSLSVEAKHKDDHSHYELHRKFKVPDGVHINEMTCKFKADGVLVLEAPFTAPPEPEPIKDTEIQVKKQ